MMDIRVLETKEIIFLGLVDENIKNPLIAGLANKNEFALSKADYVPSAENELKVTPMGSAFFIIPLLNAMCRSGTMEEKELTFEAMLTMKAFQQIPSNKRGHKLGETEKLVEQALRTCTNVKNRQTRNETAGMEMLTAQAEKMLDNKVFVFCLEPNQIDANIAGLVANKLQSKYQRPVCVTHKMEDGTYAGSMRGYTATGIDNFKAVAESSNACAWCRGHENAAGISITDPDTFNLDMNEKLKDVSTEILYYVDYSWNADEIDADAILEMADMNDYLGTGFQRPLVYVHGYKINSYMIMKDKHLKINLPNGGSAIIWGVDDGLKGRLDDGEEVSINFVAKCCANNWNCQTFPQLIIEDWEYTKNLNTNSILQSWGF